MRHALRDVYCEENAHVWREVDDSLDNRAWGRRPMHAIPLAFPQRWQQPEAQAVARREHAKPVVRRGQWLSFITTAPLTTSLSGGAASDERTRVTAQAAEVFAVRK